MATADQARLHGNVALHMLAHCLLLGQCRGNMVDATYVYSLSITTAYLCEEDSAPYAQTAQRHSTALTKMYTTVLHANAFILDFWRTAQSAVCLHLL